MSFAVPSWGCAWVCLASLSSGLLRPRCALLICWAVGGGGSSGGSGRHPIVCWRRWRAGRLWQRRGVWRRRRGGRADAEPRTARNASAGACLHAAWAGGGGRRKARWQHDGLISLGSKPRGRRSTRVFSMWRVPECDDEQLHFLWSAVLNRTANQDQCVARDLHELWGLRPYTRMFVARTSH
jgi:hypothetical protein